MVRISRAAWRLASGVRSTAPGDDASKRVSMQCCTASSSCNDNMTCLLCSNSCGGGGVVVVVVKWWCGENVVMR